MSQYGSVRTVQDSLTNMTEYVLPVHANVLGNVFGGQILSWMDVCAAICAQRHCGTVAVTAGLDELFFEQSVRVGQVVRIQSFVSATFKSSLEVRVIVTGEDPTSRVTWPCVSAYMTFVAIDAHKKPMSIPQLELGDEDAHKKHAQALARKQRRLEIRTQYAKQG